MPFHPRSPDRHAPALDVIRASAEVMVFGCHLVTYAVVSLPMPLAWWTQGLKGGVLLFFVLSGYLLYRPFLDGPVDLRRYVILRGARILPAYWIALAGTTVMSGDRSFLSDPLRFLLFAQNFDPATFNRFPGVSWTLQLEVTFYLALPAIAQLVRWFGPWLLGILGSLSFFGAIEMMALPVQDPRIMASLFPFAFWPFALGMALAHIERRGALYAFGSRRSLAAGIGLLAVSCVVGVWQTVDIVGGLASFLIVGFAVARPQIPFARGAAAWAAGISYSAYLWHVQVMELVRDRPAAALLAAIGTLVVATLVYQVVERPVLQRVRARIRVNTPVEPVPIGIPGPL